MLERFGKNVFTYSEQGLLSYVWLLSILYEYIRNRLIVDRLWKATIFCAQFHQSTNWALKSPYNEKLPEKYLAISYPVYLKKMGGGKMYEIPDHCWVCLPGHMDRNTYITFDIFAIMHFVACLLQFIAYSYIFDFIISSTNLPMYTSCTFTSDRLSDCFLFLELGNLSFHVECYSSCPITEVDQLRAWWVLSWIQPMRICIAIRLRIDRNTPVAIHTYIGT